MRHLVNTDLKCDTCPHMRWITDKEYLYSQVDHLPIVLECLKDHERIIRGTNACEEHPCYKIPRLTKRKRI